MPPLRVIDTWLTARGTWPGEPGWHFLPVLVLVGAPLFLSLFGFAMAYELVRRLPFGHRLGARKGWIMAVAIVAGLFMTSVAASL
jgi:hypothetical protein